MTIDEKIDILITRFFSGEALPEEAMGLEDWINLSPANRAYFDKHSRIFDTIVDRAADDNKQAWKSTSDRFLKEKGERRVKAINLRWIGIAASFILIVAIGLLISKYDRKEVGAIVHKADAISRKVVLKDSSEIIVSPYSSISISKEGP